MHIVFAISLAILFSNPFFSATGYAMAGWIVLMNTTNNTVVSKNHVKIQMDFSAALRAPTGLRSHPAVVLCIAVLLSAQYA